MTNDLSTYRPTQQSLESLWGNAHRDRMLAELLADAGAHGSGPAGRGRAGLSRRRVLTVGAVAAVGAAVAVIGPSVVSRRVTPTAAALDRLADLNAARPTAAVGPGQFFHQIVREEGTSDGEGPHIRQVGVRETWTAFDGTIWDSSVSWDVPRNDLDYSGPYGTIDSRGRRHSTLKFAPPSGHGQDVSAPVPRQARGYPTTPGSLRNVLLGGRRPSRGHDHDVMLDRELFLSVLALNALGYCPPQVTAAGLRALEDLPEVTVTRTDTPSGVHALKVSFADASIGAVGTLTAYFSPDSGEVVEWSTGDASRYRLITNGVVDAVPETVRRKAIAMH